MYSRIQLESHILPESSEFVVAEFTRTNTRCYPHIVLAWFSPLSNASSKSKPFGDYFNSIWPYTSLSSSLSFRPCRLQKSLVRSSSEPWSFQPISLQYPRDYSTSLPMPSPHTAARLLTHCTQRYLRLAVHSVSICMPCLRLVATRSRRSMLSCTISVLDSALPRCNYFVYYLSTSAFLFTSWHLALNACSPSYRTHSSRRKLRWWWQKQ